MVHDIYYERQRALIERSLAAERERQELDEAIRRYRHDLAAKRAYCHLQRTKRSRIVKECKVRRSIKRQHTPMEKCEPMVYRTHRFDNSYITVYCKGRQTR